MLATVRSASLSLTSITIARYWIVRSTILLWPFWLLLACRVTCRGSCLFSPLSCLSLVQSQAQLKFFSWHLPLIHDQCFVKWITRLRRNRIRLKLYVLIVELFLRSPEFSNTAAVWLSPPIQNFNLPTYLPGLECQLGKHHHFAALLVVRAIFPLQLWVSSGRKSKITVSLSRWVPTGPFMIVLGKKPSNNSTRKLVTVSLHWIVSHLLRIHSPTLEPWKLDILNKEFRDRNLFMAVITNYQELKLDQ